MNDKNTSMTDKSICSPIATDRISKIEPSEINTETNLSVLSLTLPEDRFVDSKFVKKPVINLDQNGTMKKPKLNLDLEFKKDENLEEIRNALIEFYISIKIRDTEEIENFNDQKVQLERLDYQS